LEFGGTDILVFLSVSCGHSCPHECCRARMSGKDRQECLFYRIDQRPELAMWRAMGFCRSLSRMSVEQVDRGERAVGSRVPNARQSFCAFLALAAVSLLPMAWALHTAILRLVQPNPQSPWESEILVDA